LSVPSVDKGREPSKGNQIPRWMASRAFKEAVRLSGGKVAAIVHPFYSEGDEKFVSGLKELVQKSKAPIVVFEQEEENAIAVTRERFVRFAPNRRIFIVKTHQQSHFPKYDYAEFHQAFKGAGVTTVLLGGTNCTLAPRNRVRVLEDMAKAHLIPYLPRPLPSGDVLMECVGYTYDYFKRSGYRVGLMPRVCFPYRPEAEKLSKDLREPT
ncbi:MAG: hypothetical protein V1708_03970, partial [Candidatus Micrarchaeota archaeon]